MPMGYIDEMDVLAFVTVDALGQPLLHPDDANKFGKKVASKVTRLQESLAKIDTRVDAAVRRARESAAADPSKLSRVAAVEEAGRVERAALLAKPYDPQPPQSTVGAKRKREAAPDPFEALRRAEAAHRKAAQERVRTEHEYNALTWPTEQYVQGLFEALGEAAAWRRSEHEREIRERATAAFLAAQQEECRTLPLLHAAQDAAFEEEERQLEEAKRWREEEFERRTQQCREELKREQVRTGPQVKRRAGLTYRIVLQRSRPRRTRKRVRKAFQHDVGKPAVQAR
jgi:hypothetical protein